VAGGARRKQDQVSALGSVEPPRNFTIPVDERIRALTIGAPAYAVRKRKIEDAEDRWLDALVSLHDTLTAKGQHPDEIDDALRVKAASFDYAKHNMLVATHNRWYPIEANLRIDPRTGGYLVAGRPWHEEPLATPERMLERARCLIG
jgi:hypothetical protein